MASIDIYYRLRFKGLFMSNARGKLEMEYKVCNSSDFFLLYYENIDTREIDFYNTSGRRGEGRGQRKKRKFLPKLLRRG